MSSKLGLVTRLVRRNGRFFSTSEAKLISREELEKVKQHQALFQSKDEPVHLLGTGRAHYYITCALGVAVILSTIDSIYNILTHGKK